MLDGGGVEVRFDCGAYFAAHARQLCHALPPLPQNAAKQKAAQQKAGAKGEKRPYDKGDGKGKWAFGKSDGKGKHHSGKGDSKGKRHRHK